MTLQALSASRFVRKTRLAPNEYRKNFHQIDRDIIAVITSAEADEVTPLMSKVYLRLVNAPTKYWERDGVLRIEAELRDEQLVKAWAVLCELVGVASATASKAIRWLHEQGIIGYYAGKNGVGLRIFLNRAASSIGVRQVQPGKKILAFPPGSFDDAAVSVNEPAFKDSFADPDSSDQDFDPRAPNSGADKPTVSKTDATPESPKLISSATARRNEKSMAANLPSVSEDPMQEIVARLKEELAPDVCDAAEQAARQVATRELERTRQWFETKALPKAVRVAQRETYDLLRKYGAVEARGRMRADQKVGCAPGADMPPAARPLTAAEIQEMAEACVALLEVQGKAIEATLAELSTTAGGWLLPEDLARVREAAHALLTLPSSQTTGVCDN